MCREIVVTFNTNQEHAFCTGIRGLCFEISRHVITKSVQALVGVRKTLNTGIPDPQPVN